MIHICDYIYFVIVKQSCMHELYYWLENCSSLKSYVHNFLWWVAVICWFYKHMTGRQNKQLVNNMGKLFFVMHCRILHQSRTCKSYVTSFVQLASYAIKEDATMGWIPLSNWLYIHNNALQKYVGIWTKWTILIVNYMLKSYWKSLFLKDMYICYITIIAYRWCDITWNGKRNNISLLSTIKGPSMMEYLWSLMNKGNKKC